jgi:hypothetical protein
MVPRHTASPIWFLQLILVAVFAAGIAAQSGTCSAPAATVTALSEAVKANVTASVAFGGSITGIFEHTVGFCDPDSSLLCSTSSAADSKPRTFQVSPALYQSSLLAQADNAATASITAIPSN